MMDASHFTPEQAAVAGALEGRPDVAAAYVYGSVVRRQATPLSDLDIAILFSPEVPDNIERRQIASEIAASVSERLRAPGTAIDLRDAESLPLTIQGEIVTHGIRVASGDEVRRVRFEAGVRQRYLDFLPFRDASVGPALDAMRRRHSNG